MKLLTDEQMNELAEMMTHCVPAGTGWALVMFPPHTEQEHMDTDCPLQLIANCDRSVVVRLLAGGIQMFSTGMHGPMQEFKLEAGQ